MPHQRGAPERLSRLQAALLRAIAEGELVGEGGAYGVWEITRLMRTRRATAYVAMSVPRALQSLDHKGLIEWIPYVVRGERCGDLVGLSAKGRLLVQARALSPLGVAPAHPPSIELS